MVSGIEKRVNGGGGGLRFFVQNVECFVSKYQNFSWRNLSVFQNVGGIEKF